MVGSDIPNPYACTIYVPDEGGQKLEGEKILTRLSVGNLSLNTALWTVLRNVQVENGQVWTLSMDEGSLNEVKKLDMVPYFAVDLRLGEGGHEREANKEEISRPPGLVHPEENKEHELYNARQQMFPQTDRQKLSPLPEE